MRTLMILVLALALWPQQSQAQNAISLASQRKVATPPQPGLAPSEPLSHDSLKDAPTLRSATVGVRLDIGMRGTVTHCTVVKSSGYAELDSDMCDALRSVRFQPGRDASGKPVPASFTAIYHWQLEAEPPLPLPPVAVTQFLAPLPSPPYEPGYPKPYEPVVPMPADGSWQTKATPLGDSGTWMTNDDYPIIALRWEAHGEVSFVLVIDTAGVPLDCLTTSTTGMAILDDLTCDLLVARARFKPALDAQGRPVASTWRSRVRWELPSD